VILGSMLLAGCQTTPPTVKSSYLDNAAFMNLWRTYRDCESGIDLESMQVAARRLNQVARNPSLLKPAAVPLPKAIQHWVSDPPIRLAVDPKSMAAACSLYTGQAALVAGRHDLAHEMFSAILAESDSPSSYYAEQARAGLAQATIGIHAAVTSSQSGIGLLASSPPESQGSGFPLAAASR
jgi:hypothetical protein